MSSPMVNEVLGESSSMVDGVAASGEPSTPVAASAATGTVSTASARATIKPFRLFNMSLLLFVDTEGIVPDRASRRLQEGSKKAERRWDLAAGGRRGDRGR